MRISMDIFCSTNYVYCLEEVINGGQTTLDLFFVKYQQTNLDFIHLKKHKAAAAVQWMEQIFALILFVSCRPKW